MKRINRCLALFLGLIMLVSVIPVSVFAAGDDTENISGHIHSFDGRVSDEAYLCRKANYDHSAVYYTCCSVCGLSSEGQLEQSTFEYGKPGDGYYSVISNQKWEIAPGVKETEMVLNDSTGARRQTVHIMEVDVTNPYASVLPSYMGMNPTPGNYQLGTMSQQAAWVESNMGLNVVGAMNTCLSWYDSDYYEENPDKKNEPLGVLIVDGQVYAKNSSAKTCLVVNYDEKNGVARPTNIPKVELRSTKDPLTGWEEQVVSCNFEFIVRNGVNLLSEAHTNMASKSLLGIKADGTVVMMQNDGRLEPYSCGLNTYEAAEALITLGCVAAVRCDGGGSSTYLSKRPGEELAVHSLFSDGIERPTTSGILVISSVPDAVEFAKASISAENNYYAPGCTVEFTAVGYDEGGALADIPEDVTWQVVQSGMGTVENGKFVSNGTPGKVTVQMVYNGNVVGDATVEIVVPETFAFRQSALTVASGKQAELELVATVNGGQDVVVLNYDDVVISVDGEKIGSVTGLTFMAITGENAKDALTGTITATLQCANITAILPVTVENHNYKSVEGVLTCENCGKKLNGELDGKTYIDGVLADGWVERDNNTYYFESGIMITGPSIIDGKMCIFDAAGVYDPNGIYNGFFTTEDGKTMYFVDNKYMTGCYKVVNDIYWFYDNGIGYEGEYIFCGETCLFAGGKFIRSTTAELVDAGMAGNSAHYVIYADGTMVLGGSGATFSYSNHGNRPFLKYTDSIKKIIIGENITRIGTYFLAYTGVKTLDFAGVSSLDQIGSMAFYENTRLQEVKFPDSVTYFSNMAFGKCSGLTKVVLGQNAQNINDQTFKECGNVVLHVYENSYAHNYAVRRGIPYEFIVEEEILNGIVEIDGVLYYYKDGAPYYAGLFEIDGAYYYARSDGRLVVNHMYWTTKHNDLLPAGDYAFGVDGRMVTGGENSGVFTDGIIKIGKDMFFYKDEQPSYEGLFLYEGEYYYARSNGQLAVNRTYWITKNNDLLPVGDYSFDTNGQMIQEGDGIVDVDGTLYYLHKGEPSYQGLISIGDDYYYVRSNGQLAVNREYYITRTNDLLPEGTYKFGVDGKMLLDRKITIENIDGVLYAYRDGEPYYLGLFELNGNYYYARSNRQLVVGRQYYISKTNGLLPEGTYAFDAEGKMIR